MLKICNGMVRTKLAKFSAFLGQFLRFVLTLKERSTFQVIRLRKF